MHLKIFKKNQKNKKEGKEKKKKKKPGKHQRSLKKQRLLEVVHILRR